MRSLARIEEAGARRAEHIGQEICDEIAGNPHTPVDPEPDGAVHLRDSYYVQRHGLTAVVKTSAPYWHFVEFGTGNGPEQPHVRPAIEVVRARHT